MNGKSLYSPKIKDDLIAIIYRKARIMGKAMTDIVDELLRPQLVEDTPDTIVYTCHSCKSEVDIVFNDKGYCEYCESVVFVDKA